MVLFNSVYKNDNNKLSTCGISKEMHFVYNSDKGFGLPFDQQIELGQSSTEFGPSRTSSTRPEYG